MALTYNGATAGSTLANPPVLLAGVPGGHVQYVTSGSSVSTGIFPGLPDKASGAKLWFYASSNDPLTELVALNAFSDGSNLGMTIGDVLIGVKTTANSTAPVVYVGTLVTSLGATGFGLSSNVISSTAQ